jgi:hypothetical protein
VLKIEEIPRIAAAISAGVALVASIAGAEPGRASSTRRATASQGGGRTVVTGSVHAGPGIGVSYHRHHRHWPGWYGWSVGWYDPWYHYYPGYHVRAYYPQPAARVTGRFGTRPPGAVDLNVRPRTTEVYVDGQYVDLARNLDGYPDLLWLDEGTYEITFYREGYESVTRQIAVRSGDLLEVRERLDRGESRRPELPAGGEQPADAGPPASGKQPPGPVATYPRRGDAEQ